MEVKEIKCSSQEHKEINAKIYCYQCKIYLCKKCESFHSNIFSTHQTSNLENLKKEDIFTGLCKEKDHNNYKLEFFCKSHNQLCCVACLCKIKKNEIGKHKDCIVCNLEDIKEEKIKKFKENINTFDDLSKTINDSINNLKNIEIKIRQNKEELIQNIQKIFFPKLEMN